MNNTSSLADMYIYICAGPSSALTSGHVTDEWWGLHIRSFYKYCGGVIICLFIVEVDIKLLPFMHRRARCVFTSCTAGLCD